MQKMIAVEQAKALLSEYVKSLLPITLPLHKAAGKILAETVVATNDIPAYPQSSMDGYAFAYTNKEQPFHLVGEMAAGSQERFQLETGQAVRIFTGAAVPQGADTVLMQEKARVENGILWNEDTALQKGANVRQVGSEIEEGAVALNNGDLLTPAAVGFLAGIGIASVKVYAPPKVSIIVTGNELQHPGEPLQYGHVYEANSFALLAALQQIHIDQVPVYKAIDELGAMQQLLEQALQQSDVVLLTGGVSVGDYDFTLRAFEACGVQVVFHKIKQKPGKPLLFGVKGNKLVFGLPGNPASVLTCFYVYVLPALHSLMSSKESVEYHTAKLATSFNKPAGLTQFLKAVYKDEQVHLLSAQESYKLNSFALANCLAIIPETATELAAGDVVDICLLPK